MLADIAEELEGNCDINKIKFFCRKHSMLSAGDKEKIKVCNSIYDIFEVLDPHWNCESNHLLYLLIARTGSIKAQKLLEMYIKKLSTYQS